MYKFRGRNIKNSGFVKFLMENEIFLKKKKRGDVTLNFFRKIQGKWRATLRRIVDFKNVVAGR